jgi:cytochrome c553
VRRALCAAAALIAPLLAIPTSAQQLEACLACHGASGTSATPDTPSLGGQPAFYVLAQLVLFREGRRENALMNALAKPLTNDDLRALSGAIERLPVPKLSGTADPAKVARGKAVAEANHCGNCHNADYSGGQNVPRVAYQREDYLAKSLHDYKTGKRVGYGNAAMAEAVAQLTVADLSDLAHYLAFLPAK